MKKLQKAFSLIELSIVILIIGILVAGITQSSRLVKQFKLMSARTTTQSSPVTSIKDLSLWYETSLESSFLVSEQNDAGYVTIWYDNNPQATAKNNATQSSSTSVEPKFYDSAFNGGIPGIRFDGGDSMAFDGTFLVGANYTIFVVEKRLGTDANNMFFGGTATSANANLHTGYRDDEVLFAQYSSDLTATDVGAYTTPVVRIHTFMLDSAGKKYWLNGGASADASNSQTTKLSAYAGAALGKVETSLFYNGDLGELIFFTRALKTEERQAVENYLGKKFGVKTDN